MKDSQILDQKSNSEVTNPVNIQRFTELRTLPCSEIELEQRLPEVTSNVNCVMIQ